MLLFRTLKCIALHVSLGRIWSNSVVFFLLLKMKWGSFLDHRSKIFSLSEECEPAIRARSLECFFQVLFLFFPYLLTLLTTRLSLQSWHHKANRILQATNIKGRSGAIYLMPGICVKIFKVVFEICIECKMLWNKNGYKA